MRGHEHPDRLGRSRTVLRWLAAVLFVAAGVNHFVRPDLYLKIVPPGLPRPDVLVAVSGMCEVVGGVGLLIPRLRCLAGWGLIALLVAVFPANVYMAACPECIPGLNVPPWLLWLRLPLQGVFVVWVWFIGVSSGGTSGEPSA